MKNCRVVAHLFARTLCVAVLLLGCNRVDDGERNRSNRAGDLTTTAPAAWVAGKSYAKGALVSFGGIVYECRQAHRSAVGQEPPNAPALWMRPTPSGITEWAVQTNYVVGSGVTHLGSLYECIQAHVSDSSDWVPNRTPALWRCASKSCGGGGCQGLKDGSLCDDDNVCTGVDKCKAGKCVKGPAKPNGTSCADQNTCNGAETCDGKGVCKMSTPPPTDDGDACTADRCDPLTGAITHAFDATLMGCNVLHPRVECVAENTVTGQLTGVFGYVNDLATNVVVATGQGNGFSPAPADRGQPRFFLPGADHHNVVAVPLDGGANVSWHLGQETATAMASSPRCATVPCEGTGGVPAGNGRCVPVAGGELPVPRDTIVATGGGGAPAAGRLDGSPSVTDDGAFAYSVPLAVPPGRAGLDPALSIEYHSRTGNGPLGAGWSLSGLSEISRCNKTIAQNGAPGAIHFDNALPPDGDALCIDGQQLVRVKRDQGGPPQFRTETDSFTLVTLLESDSFGPLTFEVRTRDGRIHVFGGAQGEARVEGLRSTPTTPNVDSPNFDVTTVQGQDRVRLSWALTETRDRFNNTISYFYDSANGNHDPGQPMSATPPERTLARIEYTGRKDQRLNPAHVILFRYENRPDVRFSYVGGLRVDARRRLTSVDMFAGTSTTFDSGGGTKSRERVRTYKLQYSNDLSVSHRTLLTSVTECDAGLDRHAPSPPDTAVCKPPTTFTYQKGDDQFTHRDTNVADIVGNFYISALHLADINGDGLDDLIYRQQRVQEGKPVPELFGDNSGNPLAGEWFFRLGHGDGTFSDPKTLPFPSGNRTRAGVLTSMIFDPGRVADLDMDGKADFIAYNNPTCGVDPCVHMPSGHWQYFYSHGPQAAPFPPVQSEATELATIHPRDLTDNDPPLWVADLNGDGYPEVLRPLFSQDRATVCSNPPQKDCFQAVGVRINNQGALGPWQEVREPVGTGFRVFPYLQNRTRAHWWVTDVDGDGAVEFLASEPDPKMPFPEFQSPVTVLPLLRALNLDAAGAVRGAGTTLRWRLTSSPFNDLHHYFVDVNGDGLADDLVMLSDLSPDLARVSRPFIALNTGNGFGTVTEGLLEASSTPLQGLLRKWDVAADQVGANVQILDVDQDGRQDLILLDDGGRDPVIPDTMVRTQPVVYLAQGEPAQLIADHPLPNAPPPLGGPPVPPVVDPTGSFMTAKQLSGVALSAKLRHPRADDPRASTEERTTAFFRMARLGDIDGDGLEDIVQLEQSGTAPGRLHIYTRLERADLLVKVQDGLGATAEPSYASLAESSRRTDDGMGGLSITDPEQLEYTRGTTCAFPQYCVSRDVVVVKKMVLNRGLTGQRSYRYAYEDGRTDLVGRGWLGFKVKRTTDVDTKVVVTETFDNTTRIDTTYPLAGLLTNRSIAASVGTDGTTPHVTTHAIEYEPLKPVPGTFAAVARLITDTEVEGGAEIRRMTTTMSDFDSFGNARRVLIETGNPGQPNRDTLEGTLVYHNDEPRWLIGLLEHNVTVSTGPNGEKETRTEEYFRDPTTGLPVTHTIEPRASSSAPAPAEFLLTVIGRDDFGNVTSQTEFDAEGETRQLVTAYDVADATYPVQTRSKLGRVTRFAFVPNFGELAAREDSNGVLTKWQFDGFGRLRHEERADGAHLDVTYDPVPGGMQITETRKGGTETVITADHLGREVSRKQRGFDGTFNVVDFEYEKLGRNIFQVSRPHKEGASPQFHRVEMDNLERTRFHRFADGTFREFQYQGLNVTFIDQKKNVTALDRDQAGRVVRSHQTADSRQILTSNTFGPFGVLRNIVDTKGNTTTITYDRAGRRTQIEDPDSGISKFVFNGFGELRSLTDANGVTTTRTYDDDGRPTSVKDGDGLDTIEWDSAPHGVGLPAGHSRFNNGVSDGLVSANYEYNPLSQLITASWKNRSGDFQVTHTYDEFGRSKDTSYPVVPGKSGRVAVRHSYNSFDGALQQVAPVDNPSAFFWRGDVRDAFDRLTEETFGSGARTTTTYDPIREVLQRRIDTKLANGTVLQAFAFDYDDNGNLTKRDDERSHVTETFDHDEINRLKHWTYGVSGGGQFAFRYEWDEIGNLKKRVAESGGGPSHDLTYSDRSVNAGPHAVVSSTLFGTYEYDAKGNQIRARDRAVRYNSFNLPKIITSAAGQTELGYDAAHRRAWKLEPGGRETIYVEGLYERRTEAGQVTHVFHINGANGPVAQLETKIAGGKAQDSVKYVHAEHLGSIETVTNEKGEVERVNGQPRRFKFDPFGRRIDPFNPNQEPPDERPSVRQGFTGHEHDDELDLVNMGGRIYDPRTTRFLTPDSIIGDTLDSRYLNRYSYALNSPLTVVDPSGNIPMSIVEAVRRYNVMRAIGTKSDGGPQYIAPPVAKPARPTGNPKPRPTEPPATAAPKADDNSSHSANAGTHPQFSPHANRESPPGHQSIGQPGAIGRFIPIYGNVRSAIDDFQTGHYGWGFFHSVMAVTDVFLVKAVATAAVRGVISLASAGARDLAEQAAKEGAEVLAEGAGAGGPRLLTGLEGRVVRNALEPHEFEFAKEIVAYRGGVFQGALRKYFPGIDGFMDGLPAQLKAVAGRSPTRVTQAVLEAGDKAAAAGYSGVEVFIRASNISAEAVLSGPIRAILLQARGGALGAVNVFTRDGVVRFIR